VITVGRTPAADVCVVGETVDTHLRPSFTIDGQKYTVPLHGAHHATNAALAIAVAQRVFGLEPAEIAVEIAGAAGARGRMELFETADGIAVLNDTYNANPTSMDAALIALAHLDVAGRRVAVLGDMRELGVHHDEAHREIGARAAALGLDLVVGVGAGGKAISDAAGRGGARVAHVADADGASGTVERFVAPGDAVLVKGSRAVGLERVVDALVARRGIHRAANPRSGGAA
jgi:UDP-N-acetylmuramoyl-tripeptide--D-alanyl-D-alanine ligase